MCKKASKESVNGEKLGKKLKEKENRKKVKKVLDKSRTVCYYIGALEARTSKAKKLQKNFKKS